MHSERVRPLLGSRQRGLRDDAVLRPPVGQEQGLVALQLCQLGIDLRLGPRSTAQGRGRGSGPKGADPSLDLGEDTVVDVVARRAHASRR